MRHVILTCKNHPDLRWSTKEIAVSSTVPGESAGYNETRHIFFIGTPSGKGMHSDQSGLDCTTFTDKPIVECSCSVEDLIIAEEDALVRRT